MIYYGFNPIFPSKNLGPQGPGESPLQKKTPSKDLDGLVGHLGLDCEAVEDPNGSEKRESP